MRGCFSLWLENINVCWDFTVCECSSVLVCECSSVSAAVCWCVSAILLFGPAVEVAHVRHNTRAMAETCLVCQRVAKVCLVCQHVAKVCLVCQRVACVVWLLPIDASMWVVVL
ncbi:hypothetical protein BsWGS_27108 [Bradybaena similaris]